MGKYVLVEALEDRTLFTRATGIDIASYQHPSGAAINWSSVYSAGVQFVYVKATQSNNYINPYFTSDMAGSTAADVVAGAYDFADWTISATADADHFLATASPYIGAGYLRPMLDAEQATSSNVSSWVNTWCNAVYSATGVKPIIYTYQSFAASYLDSSVTQWPLWMASPNGQNSQTGNPTATTPWSTWALWQWGGAGCQRHFGRRGRSGCGQRRHDDLCHSAVRRLLPLSSLSAKRSTSMRPMACRLTARTLRMAPTSPSQKTPTGSSRAIPSISTAPFDSRFNMPAAAARPGVLAHL